MAIVLITGQPGSGKTAKCVDMLAHDQQWANRPIFVMGIPDLAIPHEPTPPVKEWTEMRAAPEDETLLLPYFTFPPNAVVVVDECQRVYRPRAVGSKVPPEVAAFETHRHLGIDFILLTQNPGLLDANIRKLVGKHYHIAVTPFGRFLYEWTKCADVESKADRDIAARNRYILPKRAFDLYKSAEKHTKIKTRIPLYAWLFIIGLIACIGIFAYIYHRITSFSTPATVEKLNAPNPAEPSAPLTQAQYLEVRKPRIEGFAHTAPLYDHLTQPVEVPIPAGCMVNHTANSCKCIDQRGNPYVVTDAICRHIVKNGIFLDFIPTNSDATGGRQRATQEHAGGDGSTPGATAIKEAYGKPPVIPQIEPQT